ncbi:MAG TPA: hypothetical protein PKM84_00965 [Candidatus Pacearchaeota archaeon]|nr:hypothetical protein [Candidatus Pacearchaeota archaeon]
MSTTGTGEQNDFYNADTCVPPDMRVSSQTFREFGKNGEMAYMEICLAVKEPMESGFKIRLLVTYRIGRKHWRSPWFLGGRKCGSAKTPIETDKEAVKRILHYKLGLSVKDSQIIILPRPYDLSSYDEETEEFTLHSQSTIAVVMISQEIQKTITTANRTYEMYNGIDWVTIDIDDGSDGGEVKEMLRGHDAKDFPDELVEIIQGIVWELKKTEFRERIQEYRCFSKEFFLKKDGQSNGGDQYDFDRLFEIFSNLVAECGGYFHIMDEIDKQKKNFTVPITQEEKELAMRHEMNFRGQKSAACSAP